MVRGATGIGFNAMFRPRLARDRQGLTLIKLMVVIAIIGVLLAYFRPTENYRLYVDSSTRSWGELVSDDAY